MVKLIVGLSLVIVGASGAPSELLHQLSEPFRRLTSGPPQECFDNCDGLTTAFQEIMTAMQANGGTPPYDVYCKHKAALICGMEQGTTCGMDSMGMIVDCFCDACPSLMPAQEHLVDVFQNSGEISQEDSMKAMCQAVEPFECASTEDKCSAYISAMNGTEQTYVNMKDTCETNGYPTAPSGQTTCGDVKVMYREQGCCGNPNKIVDMGRRLSSAKVPKSEKDILGFVKKEFRQLQQKGDKAGAKRLAARIHQLLEKF